MVPAYTMPKDAQEVAALRVVVREGFSRDMAEEWFKDLKRSIDRLRDGGKSDDKGVVRDEIKSRKPC